MPWASYKLDERGLVMRDEENKPMLTGYCVDVCYQYLYNLYNQMFNDKIICIDSN